MGSLIKSTPADKAVDFNRAADAYRQAAELIRTANKLMQHHGQSVSYGESVAESVELWAGEAQDAGSQALVRARRAQASYDLSAAGRDDK